MHIVGQTMQLVGGANQGTFSRDSCVVDCICGGDDPSVDMTWTLGTCKSLSSSAVLLSSLMVCSQVLLYPPTVRRSSIQGKRT
jgi:hypothetical protein